MTEEVNTLFTQDDEVDNTLFQGDVSTYTPDAAPESEAYGRG